MKCSCLSQLNTVHSGTCLHKGPTCHCTYLSVGWQRLGGRHGLHHRERLRLCLVQLEQEATNKIRTQTYTWDVSVDRCYLSIKSYQMQQLPWSGGQWRPVSLRWGGLVGCNLCSCRCCTWHWGWWAWRSWFSGYSRRCRCSVPPKTETDSEHSV